MGLGEAKLKYNAIKYISINVDNSIKSHGRTLVDDVAKW